VLYFELFAFVEVLDSKKRLKNSFRALDKTILFQSLAHYNAHYLCPIITGQNPHVSILANQAQLVNLSKNNFLGGSLLYINIHELILFVLTSGLLGNLGKHWVDLRSEYNNRRTSIIPINLESFYFVYEVTGVKFNSADEELFDLNGCSRGPSGPNYKERFILKISEAGYELLDYTVSAEGVLKSNLEKAFTKENVEQVFNASHLQPIVWPKSADKSPSL
jgi:hypothetical protein